MNLPPYDSPEADHFADQRAIDFIIAHRGASGSAPENTFSAFRKAAELGARWIEIDSNSSADGEAMIFHDDTLERCSNGQGYLVRQSAQALQQLDAGSWFGQRFHAERIPTLADTLTLADSLGLGVNVEIKCTNGLEIEAAQATAKALQQTRGLRIPIMLSSFSLIALAHLRQHCPQYPRSYLCEAIPADWHERLASVGATALHCRWGELLDRQRLEQVLTTQIPLRCYTLNTAEAIEQARQSGVSGVFTNYPELALAE